MAQGLTPKQKKFIEVYAGNGTEAARLAGYAGDDNALGVAAHYNLSNPKIVEAIQAREKAKIRPLIASREKRQEFWTLVMLDSGEDMRNRLKASELLGRSEADFTDKLDMSGEMDRPLRDLTDAELLERLKK